MSSMNEKAFFRRTTYKLPDEDALRKQSLRYIAMDSWVRRHLVEVTSAQLALKTAYAAYSQWCERTGTPPVPIQAFNKALASRPETEWSTVSKKRTARGITYLNLTLRSWADTAPSPDEDAQSGLQVAPGSRQPPASNRLVVAAPQET